MSLLVVKLYIYSLGSQKAHEKLQRNTKKSLPPVSAAAMKNLNEKGARTIASGPSPLTVSSGTEFEKWLSKYKQCHSFPRGAVYRKLEAPCRERIESSVTSGTLRQGGVYAQSKHLLGSSACSDADMCKAERSHLKAGV